MPTEDELHTLTEKAHAFDRLVHDLATLLPPDAAIKKLAGLPFLEAIKGYRFVPVTTPNPNVEAPPYELNNPA